jgi:hypothetical protein
MASEVATISMHRSRSVGMLPGTPGQLQQPLSATAVPARLSPKPGNAGLPSISENEAVNAALKVMQKGVYFSVSARNLGDKLYGREAATASFRPAVPPSLPSFKALLKAAAEKLVCHSVVQFAMGLSQTLLIYCRMWLCLRASLKRVMMCFPRVLPRARAQKEKNCSNWPRRQRNKGQLLLSCLWYFFVCVYCVISLYYKY